MLSYSYIDYPYNYDEERYFKPNSHCSCGDDKKQDERISANEEAIKRNTELDKLNRELDAQQEEKIKTLLAQVEKLKEEVDFLQENVTGGSSNPIVSEYIILYPLDQEENLSDEEKEKLTIKPTDNYANVISKLASAIQSNKDIVDGDLFG